MAARKRNHDCAFLGKWHLGGHGVASLQPAAHGFQEIAFFDSGGSPYFKWQPVWNRDKPHFPFNVSVKHPDNGEPISPHSAIRVGDHKLIWDWQGKLELYDIPNDPTEVRDLAKEKPELTAKLHTQLKSWLKQNVAPRYFPQRDESVTPEAANKPFPFRNLR